MKSRTILVAVFLFYFIFLLFQSRINRTPQMAQKKPTDFLKQVVGHNVVVKLNSGVTYRGLLSRQCLEFFV